MVQINSQKLWGWVLVGCTPLSIGCPAIATEPQISDLDTVRSPIIHMGQLPDTPVEPSPSNSPRPNSPASPANDLNSSFSDVDPSDWSSEAVRTLAEKGCLSGYPDGTFRGDNVLTRNEFAAGLNACMEQMQGLLDAKTSNLVTREDLSTLFRILSTILEGEPRLRQQIPPIPPRLDPSTPAGSERK